MVHPFRRITLGLVAILVVLMTAACGASSTNQPSDKANQLYDFSYTAKIPTDAQKGGQVIIGDWQWPENVVTPFVGTVVESNISNLLWSGCVVQLPDLSLGEKGFKPDQCLEVPTIANKGESEDGKTTTLKLDPAAKWSDGAPITAKDYVLSWQYGMDDNIGGGAAPWSEMTKVTAVDDKTVRVDWKSPYGPYLVSLPYPMPTHTFGEYDATKTAALAQSDEFTHLFKANNGPFVVESWTPDQSIIFKKNTNYKSNFFKGPFLDKVIFKVSADVNVLIENYKAGTYDYVEDFTIANTANFAGIPAEEQVTSPQISYEHFDFDFSNKSPSATAKGNTTGKSIFDGPNGAKVRKAIAQAFDKCKAIKTITGKACDSGINTDENTVPPDPAYDPSVKLPAYNPTEAAKTLADAGYKDGKWPNGDTITLEASTTQGNPIRQQFMEALKAQLEANLKINVNITYYKSSQFFATYNNGGIMKNAKYDIALYAYVNTTDSSGGKNNWTKQGWAGPTNNAGPNNIFLDDPKVEDLYQKGQTTIGNDKRNVFYKELNKYLTESVINIPLYVRLNFTLAKPTFQNYKLYPSVPGNTWNAADWFTTGTSKG